MVLPRIIWHSVIPRLSPLMFLTHWATRLMLSGYGYLSVSNMFLTHRARDYCIQLMLSEDLRLARKEKEISEHCSKHDSQQSDADACPCNGAIWYGQDRVEEGIKRLNDGNSLITWLWWYFCSSTRNPFFPKESINIFYQGMESPKAWELYHIGKRNFEFEGSNIKYVYYEKGNEISARERTDRAFAQQLLEEEALR